MCPKKSNAAIVHLHHATSNTSKAPTFFSPSNSLQFESKQSTSQTEKDFIDLLFSNSKSDFYKSFWKMVSRNQENILDQTINKMFLSKDQIELNRATIKLIAKKTMVLSEYAHSLGIITHFDNHPKNTYSQCINEIVQRLEKYNLNLYNLHSAKNYGTAFNSGYYNLSLQLSLIHSLEKFIVEQSTDENKNVLAKALSGLKKSAQFYETYFAKDRMPENKLSADLDSGEMRIFSVGRTKNFHAFNITIYKNYFVVCDRYDVGIKKIKNADKSISKIDYLRTSGDGVFVYDLKMPFSELPIEDKEQLFEWLKGEISQISSLRGIPELLQLDRQPMITLPSKEQTKGTCRYASKKAAVGGAILLALLDEDPMDLNKARTRAIQLQKQFTESDRLTKIDNLIQSPLFRPEEKEQLFILTLLRNNDPINVVDQKIWDKILTHCKKSPEFIDTLIMLLKQLETKISDLEKDKQAKSVRYFDNTIALLKKYEIEYVSVFSEKNLESSEEKEASKNSP